MLLATLLFVALGLTVVMFLSKEEMLGFACTTFWALAGAQAISIRTSITDIYSIVGFASMFGMSLFTALAAFGLRRMKRDSNPEMAEERKQKRKKEKEEEEKPFDDGMGDIENNYAKPSVRSEALHKRAEERREGIRSKESSKGW